MIDGVRVTVRKERGCGFRKEGGLYLVGPVKAEVCDRLPLRIEPCPVCGERPRFTRGIAKVDFVKLFGNHENGVYKCKDKPTCAVCYPVDDRNYYLMWVGRQYTMTGFIAEAKKMGVSKRIADIPSDMVIGADFIVLARKNAGKDETGLIPEEGKRKIDVIFCAFRPMAIEKIVTKKQSEDQKFIEDLIARGITPVLEVDSQEKL